MPCTLNCSILLTCLPLLERPAAARVAGFDAVEFWWPFQASVPEDRDVDAFVRAIDDAGVQLSGLNLAAGNMPGGDRGLVSWPGRAQEFADSLDVVVGIGERTGCRAFNALYGNRQEGVDPAAQDELGVENLVRTGGAVARLGGTVLLEPLSGVPAYPLRFARDALAVADRVRDAGADNVRLLADLYHLAVNGDDVDAVIEAHAAQFGHVQIADAPGRHEPGTGGLPLRRWIARSRELGYTGRVGLEYTASQEDPFAWLRAAAPS